MATKPAEIRRPMERPAWNAFVAAYIASKNIATLKWEHGSLGEGKYAVVFEIEVEDGYMAGFRMECPEAAFDRTIRNPATAALLNSHLSAFTLCGDNDCGNLGAYFEFIEDDEERVRRLRYVLSGLGNTVPEYKFYQTLPEREIA